MVAASAIIPFYPRKSAGKTHDEPMDTVRGLPEGEPSLAWGRKFGVARAPGLRAGSARVEGGAGFGMLASFTRA